MRGLQDEYDFHQLHQVPFQSMAIILNFLEDMMQVDHAV